MEMMKGYSVYTPTLTNSSIMYVKELMVWYPLRRSLKEILMRLPPRHIKAVDGVSFTIGEGEVLALAGESGCGKTTTGRAILRLVDPTSGVIGFKPSEKLFNEIIDIEGHQIVLESKKHIDIARVSHRNLKLLRREMQIVFQDPYASLNPRYSILRTLMEALKIHGIGSTREEQIEIVAKTLELVKLTPAEEFMYRYPHQLSGGQRQRVVFARAIILKPRFIVADEPTSMLDVSIRADIIKLMMDLKEQLRLSYLFITHDLALTRYIANRIAVMYLGKIVELGDAEKVLYNPLHPYTTALLKAIPEPDPSRKEKLKELHIKGEIQSGIDIPSGCRFSSRCPILENNPSLEPLCKKVEPPLLELERNHYTACWRLVKM